MPIAAPSGQYMAEGPPAHVEIHEGETVQLKCVIINQVQDVMWSKGLMPLFLNNGERVIGVSPRISYVGNPKIGNHTIEIKATRLEDTGEYKCSTIDYNTGKDLAKSSHLTVRERPSSESSHAVSPRDFNKGTSDLATPYLTPDKEFPSSLTRLPHGIRGLANHQLNSPAASIQLPHSSPGHPITPHSLAASQQSQSSLAMNLMVSWPYLLLALAIVLSLANIYLIVSIIRQRLRRGNSEMGDSGTSRDWNCYQRNSESPDTQTTS